MASCDACRQNFNAIFDDKLVTFSEDRAQSTSVNELIFQVRKRVEELRRVEQCLMKLDRRLAHGDDECAFATPGVFSIGGTRRCA